MGSYSRNRERYSLPEVIDPPETICFMIRVPKDRYHLAAFYGAIYDLSQWINWEPDSHQSATKTAKVWKRIWQALNPTDCFPPSLCPPGQIVEDFMPLRVDCNCNVFVTCCDGTEMQLATKQDTIHSPQPPPDPTPPTPGNCYETDVILYASNMFLLPVGVGSGDVVTITNLSGGWYDGNILNFWQCPTSKEYILTACAGGDAPTSGSDPAPALPHMVLLARTGTIYNRSDASFTVPSGVPDGSQMVFQANDPTLSDNAGSASFHCKVCKALTPSTYYQFNYGRCFADSPDCSKISHVAIPLNTNVTLTSQVPDTCSSADPYAIMLISFSAGFDANCDAQNPGDIRFTVNSFSISGVSGSALAEGYTSFSACTGGSGTSHSDVIIAPGTICNQIFVRSNTQFVITLNISPC
jgi:hypothetical protein